MPGVPPEEPEEEEKKQRIVRRKQNGWVNFKDFMKSFDS